MPTEVISDDQMELNGENTVPAMEFDLAERQTLIATHPFFAILTPDEQLKLARLMFESHFNADETIVEQGDVVNNIYFIAKGNAEVLRHEGGKKSVPTFLATLHPNDVIGLSESGFFAPSGIRTATVKTTSRTIVLGLKVSDIYQFLQNHPHFSKDLKKTAEFIVRMNFIKEVTSFMQLSPGRIRWLAERLQKIFIAKNGIIFNEGDSGHDCYLIYSGAVEISIMHSNDNTKVVLADLKPPMLFGEAALFSDAPRNATARAIEDTTLFMISRQDLLALTSMEDTANKAIHTLMVERSRPIQAPNISMFETKNADSEKIFTLKNPKGHHYFRLTQEGWFIWQQIDGKKSIRDITHDFHKHFKNLDKDFVVTTIFNLTNAGFIQLGSLQLMEPPEEPVWHSSRRWWILIGIGFVLTIIAIAAYLHVFHFQKRQQPIVDQITSVAVINRVLGIDLNDTGNINASTIKDGSTPILAVRTSNAGNNAPETVDFIDQVGRLVAFDQDKNGQINMADPIYSRLELIFFMPDKQPAIERVSVADAGIRAILLNPTDLTRDLLSNQPPMLDEADNNVLMANGTLRPMRVVPFDLSAMPQQ